MTEFSLGRRVPNDFDHITKYPMRAAISFTITTVEKKLLLPYWHKEHDQKSQGSCVGHGSSMMMSILNELQARAAVIKPYTHRYDPRWLWDQAKIIDEWSDTNPGDNEGTSVRAACDVLRTQGHVLVYRGKNQLVNASEGISTNRWATTVDEIRTAIAAGLPLSIGINWYSNFDRPILKGSEYWIGEGNLGSIRGGHCLCLYGASDKRQAFILKNSWGQSYPLVWIPYTTVERLISEYGEFALVTDK